MDIRFAKETTHVAAGTGHTVLVILGTHWPADDPIVQAFPNLFTDDPIYGLMYSQPPITSPPPPIPERVIHASIESATSNPGQKRVTARPPRSSGDDK